MELHDATSLSRRLLRLSHRRLFAAGHLLSISGTITRSPQCRLDLGRHLGLDRRFDLGRHLEHYDL